MPSHQRHQGVLETSLDAWFEGVAAALALPRWSRDRGMAFDRNFSGNAELIPLVPVYFPVRASA